MMKVFDTLEHARRLEDAGVPRPQAEAHAALFAEMLIGEVATKTDLDGIRAELRDARGEIKEIRGEIKEIRGEINEIRGEIKDIRFDIDGLRVEIAGVRKDLSHAIVVARNELTIRLGTLIVVGVGALAALQKLI
jgi:chromosome segregation ATPase